MLEHKKDKQKEVAKEPDVKTILEAKINELTNDLQRVRADFENYRKQVEMQKENEKKATKLATVYKLLPLLDDLDRAFGAYNELAPVAKSLDKVLKEYEKYV